MQYRGTDHYPHEGSDSIGVLLVNHGSPDGFDKRSVRRYLARFLSDPRLIELPRWLWLPILNLFVLTTRPRRTAHKYQSIWGKEGSPIATISAALQVALEERTARLGRIKVQLGMTYGNPSIAAGLQALQSQGCTRLLVLPLYPQYSGTTIGSVFDAVTAELRSWRWVPETRFVSGYADAPLYIKALAESVLAHWEAHGRGDRLLVSYHGVPEKYATEGDPYPCLCEKTTRLLAQALDLNEDAVELGYQSKFGRGAWLTPSTESILDRWAQESNQTVDIICPGFAVDNLETLEEIEQDFAGGFSRSGGSLRLVKCLNASAAHLDLLNKLIEQHCQGWDTALSFVHEVPEISDDHPRSAKTGSSG